MSKTAVIYARVSSKEQEATGYSIPSQVALFKQYAQQKDLKIVEEFLESDSAKDSGRKLFNQMLKYVKDNKVQAIVFEKVDRMTRNFKDLITIYDLMENHDLEIHLIKNSLILDKNSRSQDKFQLDIHVVLARNYVNNLSEEVKKGMLQKSLAGGWSHKAPYGYDNVKLEGRAAIVPNDKAQYVKAMYQMAFDGHSIASIYNGLGKVHNISRPYIHKTLKKMFYTGYILVDGELVKGQHEPLVDHFMFEAVQKRLSNKNNKVTATDRVFRFSGLIHCECGCSLYGELKKGKYVTYGCGSRQLGKNCQSSTKYFSEAKIIQQLEPQLKAISLTQDDKEYLDQKIRKMFDLMDAESSTYSHQKCDEIEKLKKRISNLLNHYDDGLLTKDEYIEHKALLQNQLIKLQSEFNANIIVSIETKERFRKVFEPIVNLDKYWLKVEDYSKFQIIMRLLFTNLVLEDGKLVITWSKLGGVLYQNADCLRWRRRGDSNSR